MRLLIYSGLCVSLAVSGACSGNGDQTNRPTVAEVNAGGANRGQVEITGCLSADQRTNQYVLTASSSPLSSLTKRAATGEAETYHYQLVGGNGLQALVDKEVRVTGTIVGKGRDVDVKSTASTSSPTTSGTETTATVKTTEEIELQVEQLNVASVSGTGSPCQTRP